MASAQERQEEYANRARQVAEQFEVGDKVWLCLRNIRSNRPSKKLDWLNAKYEVTEVVSSHAYRLNTPPGIHPVFHVSLLKRAANDPLPSQEQDDTQPPPIIAEDSGEQEWFIDEILDARRMGRGHQLSVKWSGYVEPTWEPLSSFRDTAALDRYEAIHGRVGDEREPPRGTRGGRNRGCGRGRGNVRGRSERDRGGIGRARGNQAGERAGDGGDDSGPPRVEEEGRRRSARLQGREGG